MQEDLPTSFGGDEQPAAPQPTSIGKIGRYKIVRLIGEGGMGAVYEAEQDQPRRTVALKVIKPGLASPELLRRFAQESQALGRLQHPGIAQIYDAGTADTGYGPQPYFAMEYIKGEGLREHAESHRLNTPQRLDLMVKVCDAVHHAHQRGLIHRDLKPGNILVDETGQPKILDFGVARVTDSDAQATMQTDVGQLVGTLAYMSPEQVLADPLEIDTRSDVYALGVILYELLAKKLPYNISKKLHEALNAIREEDPSRLSMFDRTYRGDIETIAAKALEKDKNRRYSSAAELAADITHYLKDEPIVAQPPTTIYQLKKFSKRHKGLVLGLAAVFVVLVLGVVASTYQMIRATRAEGVAVAESAKAKSASETAIAERNKAVKAEGQAVASEAQAKVERDRAVTEKQRADTESATAKAVTEFLQKNLFAQVTGESVSGALDRTAGNIAGTFAKQPLVEAGVREAVASAYATLTQFDKAAQQAELSLSLRHKVLGDDDAETIKSVRFLGAILANLKRYAEAEPLMVKAIEAQRRRFGPDHPDTLKFMFELAALYQAEQKPDKAAPIALEAAERRVRVLGAGHKDSITSMLYLGVIYQAMKKQPEGKKWADLAYESARKAYGETDSLTLSAKSIQQAFAPKATNREEAIAFQNRAFEAATAALDSAAATSLPALIAIANQRTNIAVGAGRPADAEKPLMDALEASRRAGQDEPNLMGQLVGVYGLEKKYAEAEAMLRSLLSNTAIQKDLVPTVMPFAYRSLAMTYKNDGKYSEAEPHFAKLVPLSRANPGDGVVQTRIDMFHLADNYSGSRKYAEAERAFNDLLEVQRKAGQPEVIQTIVTVTNVGWIRLQQKRYAEAESSFREASALMLRTPANVDSWERFNLDTMLGATLAVQKKFAEAEPLLVSGYEGMKAAPRLVPNLNPVSRFTQLQAGDAILQLYSDWGKPDKRAEWQQKLLP